MVHKCSVWLVKCCSDSTLFKRYDRYPILGCGIHMYNYNTRALQMEELVNEDLNFNLYGKGHL